MRFIRGLLAVSLAAGLGLFARPVGAAPLQDLTANDASLYADAFAAAERGDRAAADRDLAQVSDPCLEGNVRYVELTHRARSASFEELSAWLKSFGDLPGAERVYGLALRRKPAGVEPPLPAATPLALSGPTGRTRPSAKSRPAREAYFSGDVAHALVLARNAGDAWIAGLAAYRLGDFTEAMGAFETIAANPAEKDGLRAAGGFWAARAAAAAGLSERVPAYLRMAAAAPDSFYGMIAARELELSQDPVDGLIEAATRPQGAVALPASQVYRRPGASVLQRLIATDPRAHRAVALAQLGRAVDAGAELRSGLAAAGDDADRAAWMRLAYRLSPDQSDGEIVLHSQAGPPQPQAIYPTPALHPTGGFTIDKALVYAVTYQESRFNSAAVSRVGAVGLMQLMPPSAASVAGDAALTSDPMPLFDVGTNLELGQAYLGSLIGRSMDCDILRAVAAYNGGAATVARTEAIVGPDADSLMVIESLPFAETRAYVHKVMAAYWAYRRQFGVRNRTLDAVASGATYVDARLDAVTPLHSATATAAPARQALEILLHRPTS